MPQETEYKHRTSDNQVFNRTGDPSVGAVACTQQEKKHRGEEGRGQLEK